MPDHWASRREASLARAARFTWPQFAAHLAQVYFDVAAAADPRLARSSA